MTDDHILRLPIKIEIIETDSSKKRRITKKTKTERQASKVKMAKLREEQKLEKEAARAEKKRANLEEKRKRKLEKEKQKFLRQLLRAEIAAEKTKRRQLSRRRVLGYPFVSSGQPTETLPDQVPRGGVEGAAYEIPPPVKGFQKRKQIRGAVERFRDDRSKSGWSIERYIVEQKKLRDQIEANKLNLIAFRKVFSELNSQVQLIQPIATNPVGFIGNKVLQMLSGAGPHGALAVAAITAVITAPEVLREVVHALSQKGLPLNRDWQRVIEDEVNGLFNIEEQKRRLLGIDAYVVTQTDRYTPDTGSNSHNSLENRDEIIISKSIGNAEKAVGVI